jgi:hypothetical protein
MRLRAEVIRRVWLGLFGATAIFVAGLAELDAAERIMKSHIYFSKIELSLIPQHAGPTLARLICDVDFRVAGYQFVPPIEPVVGYAENWVPIEVTSLNYSALNEWALQLLNRAEKGQPNFPLTVAYVCIKMAKS